MGAASKVARGVGRRQAGTPEQQARWLRQYVDCLNYFYYLLSLPPDRVPAHARTRPQTQDAQPVFAEPEAGMPGGELTEWSATLSER
jgi:hypothetical protein